MRGRALTWLVRMTATNAPAKRPEPLAAWSEQSRAETGE